MLPRDAQDGAQLILTVVGSLLALGLFVFIASPVLAGSVYTRGMVFVCVPIGMLVIGLIGTAITGHVWDSLKVGAVIGLIASLFFASIFGGG